MSDSINNSDQCGLRQSAKAPKYKGSTTDSGDYDLEGFLEEDPVLRKVVEAISLSPSAHNSQPWKIIINNNREIHLSWNQERALHCVDSYGYALVCSLGCAIEAVTEVADFDFIPGTEEDIYAPNFIAGTLRIHGLKEEQSSGTGELVFKRITNRCTYRDTSLPAEVGELCKEIAEKHSSQAFTRHDLHVPLKELVKSSAYDHFISSDYMDELFEHILMNHEKGDKTGMTMESLALNGFFSFLMWLLRSSKAIRSLAIYFGLARIMTEEVVKPVVKSGGFILISTSDWSTHGRINAGRALMRIWLELSGRDIYCQPVDFTVNSDDSKEKLSKIFNLDAGKYPVMLLRAGYAVETCPRRAPRLPLAEFCEFA